MRRRDTARERERQGERRRELGIAGRGRGRDIWRGEGEGKGKRGGGCHETRAGELRHVFCGFVRLLHDG